VAAALRLELLKKQYGATDVVEESGGPTARELGQLNSMKTETLVPSARPAAMKKYQELMLTQRKDEY